MNELATTTGKDKNIRQKIKELYKRPGGLFAKVTGILVLVAIGYGFSLALPFLVEAAHNFLILILELIGISALIALILNKDFRRGIQLMWLQFMRKFYGAIVNIDPIAILQNGINEMKQKLKTVKESVTKLESLLVGMKNKLTEYERDFQNNIDKKRALERQSLGGGNTQGAKTEALKYRSTLQLVNNNIARGEQQIKAQRQRINTSERYLDVMKKLEIAADFKVRDAEEELKFRKEEYEQAKAQTKAIRSVTSIFDGGLTRTMEEELAMTNVTDTINESIAEMNRMLDGSNEILANFEIDNAINSDKADAILEMFDNNGFSIFDSAPGNTTQSSKYILRNTQEAAYTEIPMEKKAEELPVQSKYFN